jgi:hypothetical protein
MGLASLAGRIVIRSFCPLGVPDQDLAAAQVDVLYPEAAAFAPPQPRAIEQRRHEPGGAAHLGEERPDLFGSEHDREPGRALRSLEIVEPPEFLSEDSTIQEEERRESLVLGGGAHPSLGGQVG